LFRESRKTNHADPFDSVLESATVNQLLARLVAVLACAISASVQSQNVTVPVQKSLGGGQQVISGQVFIVTKGRANLKLALVEVWAIPQIAASKHLEKRTLSRAEILSEFAPKVQELKQKRAALEADYERQTKEQEQIKEYRAATFYNAEEASEKTLRSLRVQRGLLNSMTSVNNELLKLAPPYDDANSPTHYFKDLPRATQIGKSDADGKFGFRLPRGKYVLMATTGRTVAGDDEVYHWIVNLDTAKASASLVLSNDNLVETNCRDCPVKFELSRL